MGTHQSLQQKIAIYQPPINQLILIDLGVNFRIYQHRLKLFQVMAHKFTLNNQEDVQKMIQNFIARYQHLYFVSTVYLKCDDFSTCGGYVDAVIFYQRIFTNLSKIKDIPINDALHFYAVAFKGFQILYQRFGYFQIYEDMFFLTQDSKLKVWCNRDISKNQPQQYLRDKTGKQQDMVRKIIFIIGQNTDQLTDNIHLKQRLVINGVRNFQMALQSLREICRQFGLSIPERVQCMKGLPSQEVRSVLDQYATNVRTGVYQVEDGEDIMGNYLGGNGESNVMMSNTGNNLFNSPTFIQPIVSQNGQSTSRNLSTGQKSRQSTPQRRDLNVPSIQSTNQQQPMIHTFNRRPQIPSHQGKKGIDLSLSAKKDSTSGHLNKTQSVTLLSSRKKSQDSNAQKVLLPSPKNNNNEIRTIIQNPSSIERHGLLNTQAHHNDINSSPYQVKYILSPPVPTEQQFSHPPIIEARPSYHLHTNNFSTQPIQIAPNSNLFPQQQIIRGVSRNTSKVYPSQSQSLRNPSILKQDSQFIKRGNVIQVNFAQNNNNNNNIPVQYISPNRTVFRPSVRFDESSTPIHIQVNEKNASNIEKNNGIQKLTEGNINHPHTNILTSSIIGKKSSQLDGSLQRSGSTPMLGKRAQNQQTRSTNPFQMVENAHAQNLSATKIIQPQPSTTIPLTSPLSSYLPVHSASSRYMHSNKQLHDNIPDMKYHKRQSPKKTINRLFDTKVQQLQSFNFNESRFGDANSENSRVLEIIGREKKDSMTSAFGDQQKWGDGVKYQQFINNNEGIRYDNNNRRSDSFTDPKILQMLKRPSSKPLRNQLNSLKKGSKGNKMYEFSRQTPMMTKIPSIDKEVVQNPFAFTRYQSASKQIRINGQQNISSSISRHQFQGFPSLSNLSQINKLEENTPFQQGKSSPIFNSANLKQSGKRTRFNEQNGVSRFSSSLTKKEQPVAISEFFNKYDFVNSNNDGPTLEYSFSSKKQIPIQDTEWISKYTTTTTGSINNNKNNIITNAKNVQFKTFEKKSQSFLTGFNSNESLEFELGNKLRPKNGLDSIQEEESMRRSSNTDQDDEFFRVRVSSAQRETVSNRKYKPAIDPEIGRDLQMFRKQKARNN